MTEFKVQYELDGMVFQSAVFAANSGFALAWVKKLFPNAKSACVVG